MPKQSDLKTDPDKVAEEPTTDEATARTLQEDQNEAVQAVRDAAPAATDQVALVSLHADGTPAQTAGFGIVGDREAARQDVAARLREQRISNADTAARTALAGVGGAPAEVPEPQDPIIAALTEKHEAAAGDAEGDAKSIVPE